MAIPYVLHWAIFLLFSHPSVQWRTILGSMGLLGTALCCSICESLPLVSLRILSFHQQLRLGHGGILRRIFTTITFIILVILQLWVSRWLRENGFNSALTIADLGEPEGSHNNLDHGNGPFMLETKKTFLEPLLRLCRPLWRLRCQASKSTSGPGMAQMMLPHALLILLQYCVWKCAEAAGRRLSDACQCRGPHRGKCDALHSLYEYASHVVTGALALTAANLTDETIYQAMSAPSSIRVCWQLLVMLPIVSMHQRASSESGMSGWLACNVATRFTLALWKIVLRLCLPNKTRLR